MSEPAVIPFDEVTVESLSALFAASGFKVRQESRDMSNLPGPGLLA